MQISEQVDKIRRRIDPLRRQIIQHPVYSRMNTVDDLKVFMQYHVYAVWDFMSLLKALQQHLTCTRVPWFPSASADSCYLINEIVVGEESDVDMNGERKSHFEIYLDAMQQCGADLVSVMSFINELQSSGNFDKAYTISDTPAAAREFVDFTFDIINSNKPHLQAAIFTFGREDLIPGMFISLIQELHRHFPDSVSVFKYYIERHIEVDGDHHSQLALQMTANLCGNDVMLWQEAEDAVVHSLEKRIALWNGVYKQLEKFA